MDNALTDRITIRLSNQQNKNLADLINHIDSSISKAQMIRLLLDAVHSEILADKAKQMHDELVTA